ncbi:hypothetical protein ABPG72_022602 [Tetrahymena utriculariae]
MGKLKQLLNPMQKQQQEQQLPEFLKSKQLNEIFQIQEEAQQKFQSNITKPQAQKRIQKQKNKKQLQQQKHQVDYESEDQDDDEQQQINQNYQQQEDEDQYFESQRPVDIKQLSSTNQKSSFPIGNQQIQSTQQSLKLKEKLSDLSIQSQNKQKITIKNEKSKESTLTKSRQTESNLFKTTKQKKTVKKSLKISTLNRSRQIDSKKSKSVQDDSQKRKAKKRSLQINQFPQTLDESIKTSRYLSQKSFKWLSKAKSMIRTIKKGAKKQNREKAIFMRNLKKANQKVKSLSNLNVLNIQRSFKDFKTIQDFTSNMLRQIDIFTNIKDQNQNIFHLYCQLDKGSFGQVDLYFCEIEQQFLNNKIEQDVKIEDIDIEQSINMQQTLQPVTENTYSYNLRSLKSKKNRQNLSSQSIKFTSNALASTLILDKNKISNIISSTDSNGAIFTSPAISNNDKQQYFPVAGKKFSNKEEFIRELFIMNQISSAYMPKIRGQDIEEQIIFLELGLCNLYKLKIDSQINNYKLTDEFTFQVLINIFNAIESLLANKNPKIQTPFPIFHSDIKPQNIILTATKHLPNQSPEIKLLLIDYGGASSDIQDYWSYYTPAFVCQELWNKAIEGTHKKEKLSWQEIRYAEFYAACRTIQYIIIDKNDDESFKKENYKIFINKYQSDYPKTCQIIEKLFDFSQIAKLDDNYKEILSVSNLSLQQLTNLKMQFDAEKLYQISKIYEVVNI